MAERKRKIERQEVENVPKLKEIHNLRKAQENLKTLDSRLNHIFNTLDNSFWGVDMVDFKMLYASPANEKIYGYTEAEFLLTPALWYQVIIPEDRHIGKRVMREIANGLPLTVEYRILHKNGSIRWVEVRLTPTLDDIGKLILVDGITIDITERKKSIDTILKSEERFKNLVENISGVYWVNNLDTYQTLYISPSYEAIWGRSCEELYKDPSAFINSIHPDDKTKLFEVHNNIAEYGQVNISYRILRPDGEVRWISAKTNVSVDNNGSKIEYGYAEDITERKKAEEEIAKLNESLELKVEERTAELKQLNRELEAFNSTVSHDLQNPIRSLAGFSKLLINDYSDKLDDDGKEYLRTIEASAKSMSSLIRDLLNFAKLGKVAVAKTDVDMTRVAQTVIKEIKPMYQNLRTEVVLHDLKPAYCDAGLIRQVWDNLIGNAVKYSSKKEKPLVEIGMQQINGEAVYYVRDNGAGFDMSNSDKLFKVFERLHKHEFEGTGVGLSTVERIITKQGGRIWAESKVEEGAVFYFTLPDKPRSPESM